ncbi:MAG TPA: hypothetical protein VI248_02220 [Kineosporiaceae bacterium]
MSLEGIFLLGYANPLLLAAIGLHRLGHVNSSPWRSRALAGHRRRHPQPAADTTGAPQWPHGEQPRLHTAIATVAATAGLVLAAAGLWRHHDPLQAALFTLTCVGAGTVLIHLIKALRR